MKTARKVLLVVLCAALLVGASVAGTLAYLSKTTEKITNTFTIGNIDLTLTETKPDGKSAKLIPGTDVAKNPKVTLSNTTEPCWVFVKVEEATVNGITFGTHESEAMIQYGINTTDWTPLDGVSGVYYHKAENPTTDSTWNVLTGKEGMTDGYVHISDELTKSIIDNAGENPTITLSFTAYAIQSEGFATAAAAWAKFDTAD